jgi:gamma-glutamylcyclotransferase (GGCT)/AIG2-like uncharacterized protein YtfP/glutaredoxin-related protein/3-polyprenyl-4-hydroxybenzoate decarboxylase
MQDNNLNNNISSREWAMVIDAIPGVGDLPDPEVIRSNIQVLQIDEPALLPVKGMYIVIEGSVALLFNSQQVATADPGDYFYEEYLVIRQIPMKLEARAAPATRLAFVDSSQWDSLPDDVRRSCLATLFGDLVNVYMHDFQQPINCCNITAAALSLTALGFSCEVNDFFKNCALPVSYVVNEGMTLGELYDVACTYIYTQGLREEVGVQAYFFDEEITTEQHLIDSIAESDRVGGDNDILVANFGVNIAHGESALGGGHFALIAKCNPSTGLIHMIDVHPEKYGKMWVTTTKRLYESMAEHDGSSMRSRGLMRFVARKAISTRLETLVRECIVVDSTRYLELSPEKRRKIFNRSSTNLNSLCVLSLSMGILGHREVDEDIILAAANISYTAALTYETTAEELSRVANKYLAQSGDHGISCQFYQYDRLDAGQSGSKKQWFKNQMQKLGSEDGLHLLVNINFNEVLGYTAIHAADNAMKETPLLKEFWCICLDYDSISDIVTMADMSPATSQVWQAPLNNLFRGLRENDQPAVLCLARNHTLENVIDVGQLVQSKPVVLFYSDEDPWSYMVKSMLANIGVTDLHAIDVSGYASDRMQLRQQLVAHSGKDKVPYLYFKGACLGEAGDIATMVKDGVLQKMLDKEGIPVLLRNETPSLDENIFSYPKGGLTDAPDGKRNILLCACGSSAADKIPELVGMLVDAGHNVKLLPTVSAEHFFKDIGMEKILEKIKPSDIYRDDDEWNFRYTEFGMPLRAAHLALCDWADSVIVSPITCNTMGKIASGIADNILSSVFVAWQYQKKPVILCPACNTHMWNNLTTQNNVNALKRLGAHIEGPRSGMLSNGSMGTGMMATPDDILAALDVAFGDLDNQAQRIMKWGKEAAAADDYREWRRIYRAIDEGVVGVNIVDNEFADSLLHYAAGGEGKMRADGIEKGVPDIEAIHELISRGIDLNMKNDHDFTSLHVAIMNNSIETVRILLDAGADAIACLPLADRSATSSEIREALLAWAEQHDIDYASLESMNKDDSGHPADNTYLYFTYGSLKRGFPNFEAHATILHDFTGVGVTRQRMPLVVQLEANCSNSNCPYLHRMASLVDVRGKGSQIHGEVFRVNRADLKTLDKLEGYFGPGNPENVYERKTIAVQLEDEVVNAFVYFVANSRPHLQELQDGLSETVAEYTLDMAKGEVKPGFEAP